MRDEIMRLAERVRALDVRPGQEGTRDFIIADINKLRALARTDHVEDRLGVAAEGWQLVPRVASVNMVAAAREAGAGFGFGHHYAKAIAAAPAPDNSAGNCIAAMSRMKDAAMAAHKLCYEAMLKHPDVDTLGDDGELHKAIHAIVGVDTPNYVASPDHSAGAGGMAPQVDVGTIGHVSRDKTTLTAALMKVGQVEAQRKVGTVADISDEDLLRRAMSNLFPRSIRVPAWSRVSDVFGLGSTYSRQLCVRFGRDPETGKPTALAQPADADAEGAR